MEDQLAVSMLAVSNLLVSSSCLVWLLLAARWRRPSGSQTRCSAQLTPARSLHRVPHTDVWIGRAQQPPAAGHAALFLLLSGSLSGYWRLSTDSSAFTGLKWRTVYRCLWANKHHGDSPQNHSLSPEEDVYALGLIKVIESATGSWKNT